MLSTEIAPEHAATVQHFYDAIQASDYPTLLELLTPEAVTGWPQSGERVTGAMSCVRVFENYPGGPPSYRVDRIVGSGDVWVAELIADYGTDRWYTVGMFEFEGDRIARMTEYFGPAFPAPDWRKALVDPSS
jgi:limonene-1,2-epoxide hydrolase